jgi:hypothetical protein
MKKRIKKGQSIRLQDQVNHPALFRTPDAGCSRGAQSAERFAKSVENERLLTLNDQIAHLWPTPRATDADHGGPRQRDSHGNMGLPALAALYPTPTANDSKNNNPPSQRKENGRHSDKLNVVAGGSLNPEWVEWLQGLPLGWTDVSGGDGSQIFPAQPEA